MNDCGTTEEECGRWQPSLSPPAATHHHHHPAIRHSASGNQGSEARTRLAFPCIVVIHQMLDVVYLYKYLCSSTFAFHLVQVPGARESDRADNGSDKLPVD